MDVDIKTVIKLWHYIRLSVISNCHSAKRRNAQYCYAEFYHSECIKLPFWWVPICPISDCLMSFSKMFLCNFLQTIVMLNAIMPSVIMLNVFISNVIALNIVMWEFYNIRYHFERPIYLLMLVKDLGLSVDFFSLVKWV
jgi:hypothetical protein